MWAGDSTEWGLGRGGGIVKGWGLDMLGGWGGGNEFGMSLVELISLLSLEKSFSSSLWSLFSQRKWFKINLTNQTCKTRQTFSEICFPPYQTHSNINKQNFCFHGFSMA